VCDIYSEHRHFDIILLKKYNTHIQGYRVFNRESFQIPLKYVPIGHKLVYEVDGEEKEHLHFEGTPFEVFDGNLVLYQRKPKRLGFILEEHSRSTRWPFE
jgi:hypothetical protein